MLELQPSVSRGISGKPQLAKTGLQLLYMNTKNPSVEYLNLTPSALFGDLPVLKIRFVLHIPRRSRLPHYLGSAWRGLIGWEMQRLICPFNSRPVCKDCIIKNHCPYYLLFEKETAIPGIKDAPRGYILYPPVQAKNDRDELEITLIGHCTRLIPVVIAAIMEGRSSGLGAERIPYDIIGLWEKLPGGSQQSLSVSSETVENVSCPFPLQSWIDNAPQLMSSDVFFLTPVRLRKQGKYLSKMDWLFFFATIVCRLEALNCLFHTGKPLGREMFKNLQSFFESAARMDADLQWVDYARFSNRQFRKVMMGGLVGSVKRQDPDALEAWWQAASLLHAGKGASMGLGKIVLN